MRKDPSRSRSMRPTSSTRVLAALLLPALIGCDGLLEVSNPGSVEASDLENAALSETMVNSALGRFECAFVNHVIATSLLSEELLNSSNWAGINPFARRTRDLENNIGGCPTDRTSNATGAYSPLQQARFLAEDGARRIAGFPDDAVPEKDRMLAAMAAYAGYATQLLGEGWCEMAFDGGPLQTRQQVFQRAEERFTEAIALAQATGDEEIEYMALLGRARSRLNQNDLDGAASDASLIPEGFVRYAEYFTVSGDRENRIFNYHNLNRFVTTNWMRYGNLMIGDVPDHRVPVEDTGELGQSGGVPFWAQQKYASASAPIPIASWEEAQLIIAEAQPAQAAAAIDRLRSSQGLPGYVPSGDGVLADVLEERRRQLFLEGHRHNDMLRHNIPFPTGTNHMGDFLGDVTCLPLPLQEIDNNPNIG